MFKKSQDRLQPQVDCSRACRPYTQECCLWPLDLLARAVNGSRYRQGWHVAAWVLGPGISTRGI
jgi:hypothetical protein